MTEYMASIKFVYGDPSKKIILCSRILGKDINIARTNVRTIIDALIFDCKDYCCFRLVPLSPKKIKNDYNYAMFFCPENSSSVQWEIYKLLKKSEIKDITLVFIEPINSFWEKYAIDSNESDQFEETGKA